MAFSRNWERAEDNKPISSLRFVVCGAAPLSVELFNRFEKHSGIKILEGYGLTESAVACAVNPKDGERKIGSIGLRMPYQQMKIAILDDDGNYVRNAETGKIGVVCIKGPCVFKGYVEEVHLGSEPLIVHLAREHKKTG